MAVGYTQLRWGVVALVAALTGVTATELLLADSAASAPATAPATRAASTQSATKPAGSQPATKPGAAKLKAEEEATLDFLKIHEPEVYKSIQLLREKDPKTGGELLKDLTRDVRRLAELQKNNPALFAVTMEDRRLSFQALQLAKEIREVQMAPEVKQKKQETLGQLVGQQFEVRQKKRQMELEDLSRQLARQIEDMQKRLDRLKGELETREKNKTEQINQRVKDLMSKKEPRADW